MKTSWLILLMTTILQYTAGQGIQFDTTMTSWTAILQKASHLDKPIFVDVYTTWCGPCRWMQTNIFTQRKVGNFFNQHFLPIMIDAEKGFGIKFTSDNHINAYPTLLFFSSQGNIILGGVVGSLSLDPSVAGNVLLRIGDNALKNLRNGISIKNMDSLYKAGNRDDNFLRSYIKKLTSDLMPAGDVIEQYLHVIPKDSLYTNDTYRIVNTEYYGRIRPDDIALEVLLHAYKNYPVKSTELQKPWMAIRSRLLDQVDSAGILHNQQWLNDIIMVNNKLDSVAEIQERERNYLLCRYYIFAKDTLNAMEVMNKFARKYILMVNTDSLYKYDMLHFRKYALLKFGNGDKNEIASNKNTEWFLHAYEGDTRLAVEELSMMMSLTIKYFQIKDKNILDKFRKWQDGAIILYKDNPVFVNPVLFKYELSNQALEEAP